METRTKDGDLTPLHLACQYNHKDVSQQGKENEGGKEGGRESPPHNVIAGLTSEEGGGGGGGGGNLPSPPTVYQVIL